QAEQDYRHGHGVDPIAGAEAVISHLLVRQFKIPSAHAPALAPIPSDPNLSPRSAAEEIGYTFLPCVLVGLSRAPQFILEGQNFPALQGDIWANQVDAVIIPASAAGSSAILSLTHPGTQIIAVAENTTQMQVPPEALGIKCLRVNSYLEALGVLVAHKAGIHPTTLSTTGITSIHR
ncbi:MAG: DUF3326 domain-containing protein, partial [Nostocaceae cyanobacterium]|nr:DUF3326 domain-containing protein [Nostocaceae cyanobacterium]